MAALSSFARGSESDGKLRTGSLTRESDRTVIARELRKQGLTPVYVGVEPKKKASS